MYYSLYHFFLSTSDLIDNLTQNLFYHKIQKKSGSCINHTYEHKQAYAPPKIQIKFLRFNYGSFVSDPKSWAIFVSINGACFETMDVVFKHGKLNVIGHKFLK